jgi:hypothetical protein
VADGLVQNDGQPFGGIDIGATPSTARHSSASGAARLTTCGSTPGNEQQSPLARVR